MSKNILIGITPRFCTEDGVFKYNVNQTYINAMNSIGFNSIMLTLDNPKFEDVLDLCDAFLVTGGIDMNPKWFNEEMNGTHEYDDRLDILDKQVIDYALKHKKPLLGICRGHQVINVFMGGTLIQDIGTAHKSVRHNVKTFKNDLIDFEPLMEVNSYHHQVCKDLAPDLIELAVSENEGYNEAYYSKKYPILGIQWHPEKIPTEETSKKIFAAFKKMVLDNSNK